MRQEEYRKMFELEDSHWWFSAKRMYAGVLLNSVKSRFSRILDVGCGTGRNLLLLKRYGQAFGVDLSDQALNYCRRRGLLRVKKASAEGLPFNGGFFDLVTLFDVLYHRGIKNDLAVLKEAYRVIRPGGYLLATDCAHQWLYGPHDLAMQARQRYSKTKLTAKVKRAGFVITRASYMHMFVFPVFVVNRLWKRFLNLRAGSDVDQIPGWLNQLLIAVSRLEAAILKLVDLPWGSSIIILAKKP